VNHVFLGEAQSRLEKKEAANTRCGKIKSFVGRGHHCLGYLTGGNSCGGVDKTACQIHIFRNLIYTDLRRHAATFASRSGTPIEIVSKVIMRHAHLSTTQRYLGKVTDVEAMRWIENLYA
jgi:integrase